MAKICERLLSTNILREKRRDSFDPHLVTLLGEDIICMVNLLEIPRVIVFLFCFFFFFFFFFYEAVSNNVLLAFYSVCHVLDRDKTKSLENEII